MWMIVLCSQAAAGIAIHRFVSLRRETVMPRKVEAALERADELIVQGDYSGVQSIVSRSQTPLGRIGRVALSPTHRTREEAAVAVEAIAREEVVKLQTGLAALEVIITIAPLLGLLGTVSGLVNVFDTLGQEGADASDPTAIAAGIAMALNTTIAGLAVAVPVVIVHSYFSKRIESMAVRMEVLMAKVLHAFHRHGGSELEEKEKTPDDFLASRKSDLFS